MHDCPRTETLLPAEVLSYLKGYHRRTLAPQEKKFEAGEFLDPMLGRNQKKDQKLVSELHRRGLTRALGYALKRGGLFAVWDVKGQSQRPSWTPTVPTLAYCHRPGSTFRRPMRWLASRWTSRET